MIVHDFSPAPADQSLQHRFDCGDDHACFFCAAAFAPGSFVAFAPASSTGSALVRTFVLSTAFPAVAARFLFGAALATPLAAPAFAWSDLTMSSNSRCAACKCCANCESLAKVFLHAIR